MKSCKMIQSPKGEMDEEDDENESVYFMQFGEEILQEGRAQKRKSQKGSLPTTSVPKKRSPPTCSHCQSVGHRSSNKKCPAL
jgi:hypothetical protein